MIIFNKSAQQQKDFSFILPSSSTTEDEVKKLAICENNINNHQKIPGRNLKNTNILTGPNKKFLLSLGFKLKK